MTKVMMAMLGSVLAMGEYLGILYYYLKIRHIDILSNYPLYDFFYII